MLAIYTFILASFPCHPALINPADWSIKVRSLGVKTWERSYLVLQYATKYIQQPHSPFLPFPISCFPVPRFISLFPFTQRAHLHMQLQCFTQLVHHRCTIPGTACTGGNLIPTTGLNTSNPFTRDPRCYSYMYNHYSLGSTTETSLSTVEWKNNSCL